MKTAILSVLAERPCTFAQLSQHLDELDVDRKGDYVLEIEPNAILWVGMSAEYSAAVAELIREKRIATDPASLLDYLIDGEFPKFPIPDRRPPSGYKRSHWIPTTVRLEKE